MFVKFWSGEIQKYTIMNEKEKIVPNRKCIVLL